MKAARKLNFNDTFRMARIINESGITMQQFKVFFDRYDSSKDKGIGLETVGMDFVELLLTTAPKVEEKIYEFLAGLASVTPEEIANADVTEIIELVGDIIATNRDIKDFFIRAVRSRTVLPST